MCGKLQVNTIGFLLLLLLEIAVAPVAIAEQPSTWDPATLGKENILEFLTVGPEEGEHWSKVWVVEVGGQLYLRLGRRAAARFEKNTTAPYVKVRIAGLEFDHVHAEPAPEMANQVAVAMAAKYWSDLLIRFASHPLTIRLSPPDRPRSSALNTRLPYAPVRRWPLSLDIGTPRYHICGKPRWHPLRTRCRLCPPRRSWRSPISWARP
jgi:hypothetical protein